jgi:hypothetical protein
MAKYRLRYYFDAGAGVCLWAANDAARERFGYPIDAKELPLPENTWRRVLHLCYWYDTCIDWAYPPDPSPWDAAERDRFCADAQKSLAILREQLRPEFEIVDDSRTADPT